MTQRRFLIASACILAAYAFRTAAFYTQGELALDEAATFFIAARPLRAIPVVALTFHSQPPLFYLALHQWLHLGDTEPVLRALPMIFMIGAALTLLATSWLPRETRLVATALLLLTPYADYLTSAVRPYSLTAWFGLWSTLLLIPLLRPGARPGWSAYARYVAATVVMSYTNAMAAWVLPAHALCLLAAAIASARSRPWDAVDFLRPLAALSVIAVCYLPYVVGGANLAGQLGHPPLAATIAAALNPRFFWSGPAYMLAMPLGLGYLAMAAAACALWIGVVRRDPAVGALAVLVGVQIAMTHGFLEGRSSFSFRYLAPAYPALCLLAAIGVEWIVSRAAVLRAALPLAAAAVLAASVVMFARAPQAAPIGPWRQLASDLRRWSGAKFVFFDVGWDAMRLQYEARHDPDVHVMSDPGSGWASLGRPMTPAYVSAVVDRYAGPATMFLYQYDPVIGARVFDGTFAPAMAAHGCARVLQRDVPTYERTVPGDGGALVAGYACRAR